MYRKLVCCLIATGALVMACGDDDDSSDGDGGTAGTGGTARGGNAGTGGTTPRGGTGGDAGSDTGGTAGMGEGGGVACASDDPASCVDDATISVCDPDAGNTYQPLSCADDFCPALGLEEGPCEAEGGDATCACGDPIDADCFAGADELCSCYQGSEGECLTDGDLYAWYLACLEGDADSEEIVRCFATGGASLQECSRTVAECVAD